MNDSTQKSAPISCSFYDYLEEAATLGRLSIIEYMKDNCLVKVESAIRTLIIKNKVEYLVLDNGQSIRLDYLRSFNGKPLPKSQLV